MIAALAVGALLACSPSTLHYRVGRVEGAAGTFLIHLQVRSGATCNVRGYPALRLVGRAGALPTRVRHGGLAVLNRPVRTVVVTPTRPAHLFVAYNDVPVHNERRCRRGIALLVAGARVNVATAACDHGRLLESPYIR